jgi:hypothetical protein
MGRSSPRYSGAPRGCLRSLGRPALPGRHCRGVRQRANDPSLGPGAGIPAPFIDRMQQGRN